MKKQVAVNGIIQSQLANRKQSSRQARPMGLSQASSARHCVVTKTRGQLGGPPGQTCQDARAREAAFQMTRGAFWLERRSILAAVQRLGQGRAFRQIAWLGWLRLQRVNLASFFPDSRLEPLESCRFPTPTSSKSSDDHINGCNNPGKEVSNGP